MAEKDDGRTTGRNLLDERLARGGLEGGGGWRWLRGGETVKEGKVGRGSNLREAAAAEVQDGKEGNDERKLPCR